MLVKVVLVDINTKMIQAWRSTFEENPEVDIIEGSMLEQTVSAWVSPTNSRGSMDGGLDLVIEVHCPDELAEPAQNSNLPLEPARVDVLPVTRDVPAAGEHQPRARCCEVEHRLSGPRRVAVDTPGDQHGKDPVALRHRHFPARREVSGTPSPFWSHICGVVSAPSGPLPIRPKAI